MCDFPFSPTLWYLYDLSFSHVISSVFYPRPRSGTLANATTSCAILKHCLIFLSLSRPSSPPVLYSLYSVLSHTLIEALRALPYTILPACSLTQPGISPGSPRARHCGSGSDCELVHHQLRSIIMRLNNLIFNFYLIN